MWLSLARAPGLGPGGRRFESCHPDFYKYARVAQLVERDLAKVEAAGSSPVSRSFLFLGFMRVPRFSESAFNLRNWACWKVKVKSFAPRQIQRRLFAALVTLSRKVF